MPGLVDFKMGGVVPAGDDSSHSGAPRTPSTGEKASNQLHSSYSHALTRAWQSPQRLTKVPHRCIHFGLYKD